MVVRYRFHYKPSPNPITISYPTLRCGSILRIAVSTYPDLGSSGSGVVVVVYTIPNQLFVSSLSTTRVNELQRDIEHIHMTTCTPKFSTITTHCYSTQIQPNAIPSTPTHNHTRHTTISSASHPYTSQPVLCGCGKARVGECNVRHWSGRSIGCGRGRRWRRGGRRGGML